MTQVILDISVSLDGFVAGPDPTLEDPLGKNGESLHEWVIALAAWREPHGMEGGETGPVDELVRARIAANGAVVMGRKMFNGGSGPWEDDPNPDGWWGDEPPFHLPVFVLTHHPRETVEKAGGTSFTFVTDGIESALAQARAAAGDKDVQISGGANVTQQALAAGLLDELHLHIVPVLLGGGTRLFADAEAPVALERTHVLDTPEATHATFRVSRAS